MLFIKNLKLYFNVQSDSIKVKLLSDVCFTYINYCFGLILLFVSPFFTYMYIDYSSRLYPITRFNLYLFVAMTT